MAPGDGAVPMSGHVAPVLHLADIALPEGRGDYGSGAVQRLGPANVFAALVEFGSESVGTAMFSGRGWPRLRARDLHAQAMQRPIDRMAGVQQFFVVEGRAFCLYCVVGSSVRRGVLVDRLNAALAGVRIEPR